MADLDGDGFDDETGQIVGAAADSGTGSMDWIAAHSGGAGGISSTTTGGVPKDAQGNPQVWMGNKYRARRPISTGGGDGGVFEHGMGAHDVGATDPNGGFSGNDGYVDQGAAAADPLSWKNSKYEKIRQQAIDLGFGDMVGETKSDFIDGFWAKMVAKSIEYQAANKAKVSPLDAMHLLGSTTAGEAWKAKNAPAVPKPVHQVLDKNGNPTGETYTTSSSIDPADFAPDQVHEMMKKAYLDATGVAPSEDQMNDFYAKVLGNAKADPATRTTRTTTNEFGDTVSSSQVHGGYDANQAGLDAADLANSDPHAAEFDAAGKGWDIMSQVFGGGGG